MLAIINSTFIAYLYYSYEYKKVDKLLDLGYDVNYDINHVVRGRIVSVSNRLMTKNLVVSELLSIFAMLFEHRIFEHRISEQKCDIPLYYWRSIGEICFYFYPNS
ncbi:hypothetical protein DWV76_00660 [Segatella copri]|uniref:Uncharacterized protein n=1 Tax=Segatella copri TaxID=165179 RepID=A0AA92W6K4_9BACT|nr:hypothetical protein DWV76_00660 [Segatella copri]